MVECKIIGQIKQTEKLIRYKAKDKNGTIYNFNYFFNSKNKPLSFGTIVKLEKEGSYWNFKSVVNEEENKSRLILDNSKGYNHIESEIINADEYMITQDDKILFGQSANIVYSFYTNEPTLLPTKISRQTIKLQIKEVFETLKEARREILRF